MTKPTEHTPGPWVARNTAVDTMIFATVKDEPDDEQASQRHIVTVTPHVFATFGEHDANVALIARAPDQEEKILTQQAEICELREKLERKYDIRQVQITAQQAEIDRLRCALQRIANTEIRLTRKGHVGSEEVGRLQRTARTALKAESETNDADNG